MMSPEWHTADHLEARDSDSTGQLGIVPSGSFDQSFYFSSGPSLPYTCTLRVLPFSYRNPTKSRVTSPSSFSTEADRLNPRTLQFMTAANNDGRTW